MRTLVFEYRVISLEYFLDNLSQYEANECIKNLIYLDRDFKEIERYQLYVLVNANSKNQLTAQKIMKLPWDNKFLNETEFEYDEKKKQQLDNKSDAFTDILNSGKLQLSSAENIL